MLKNTQCPKKTSLKIHHFNTGTTLRLTNNDSENKFDPNVMNATLRNKLKFENTVKKERPKSRAMERKMKEPRILAEFSVAFRDYAVEQMESDKKAAGSFFIKAKDLRKIFLDIELKLGFSIINEEKLYRWLKTNYFRDNQALSYKEYMRLAKAMMSEFINEDKSGKRRRRKLSKTTPDSNPQTSWDNLSYENYFKGGAGGGSGDRDGVGGDEFFEEDENDNCSDDVGYDSNMEDDRNSISRNNSTSYLVNQRKSAEASLFTYDQYVPLNNEQGVSVSADEMVSLVRKQHWEQRKEEKAKRRKEKAEKKVSAIVTIVTTLSSSILYGNNRVAHLQRQQQRQRKQQHHTEKTATTTTTTTTTTTNGRISPLVS